MGFFCKLVCAIRELHCSFSMPDSIFIIRLFVVFGSRAMGVRRQLVLLGGLSMCLVHVVSRGTAVHPFLCTRQANLRDVFDGRLGIVLDREMLSPGAPYNDHISPCDARSLWI
jgi:hypothetical protein